MKIHDSVYGLEEITENVLIELINSNPLQRLKGIKQAGISGHISPKSRGFTRYDHSTGVLILLKRMNASLEEQIAGLLHDISHTAFSHVIDHVFPSKDHVYHEKFHKKIILDSEIPYILKNSDIDLDYVLEEINFPLLETKIPDLCADRIDYTLRELQGINRDKSKFYLQSFFVLDNEIIIKNRKDARNLAEDYIKLNKDFWANINEVALFQILADAIKIGLVYKIIHKNDLFKDDMFLLDKLKNSNSVLISYKLNMLNPGLKVIDSTEDYDFFSRPKLRYIDPKFIEDGKIKRLSESDEEFSQKLVEHKNSITKGYHIKIINH